jgi:hypothetical protein
MAGAASAHQAATASREQSSQQRAGRTRRTSADPQQAQEVATAAAAAAPAALDSLSRLQQLADASPRVAQLQRLQALADASPQVAQMRRLHALAAARSAPVAQLAGGPEEEELVQGKFATAELQPQLQQAPRANNTGLPDQLKSGIESLSGLSMDHVRVHYNSAQPAQLNALAYAQGSDIHLAPGQERHLPHEAWHVVQQAQGRVRPTLQLQDGVPVNDDAGLEREADVMGPKALERGRRADETHRSFSMPIETAQRTTQAQTSQLSAPVLQATFGNDHSTQLNSLASLNAALALLNPVVAAVTLAGVGVAGATAAMLDQVIAANKETLYDQIGQADVIAFYYGALATAVDTQPPTYSYDTHGNKHFPGGPSGTKFSASKETVNPQLESLILAQIGRIRRDAAGAKTNYYYTLAGITQCRGKDLVIQINYNPATDTIDYHGYPDDNVQVRSLSRDKGGQAIP